MRNFAENSSFVGWVPTPPHPGCVFAQCNFPASSLRTRKRGQASIFDPFWPVSKVRSGVQIRHQNHATPVPPARVPDKDLRDPPPLPRSTPPPSPNTTDVDLSSNGGHALARCLARVRSGFACCDRRALAAPRLVLSNDRVKRKCQFCFCVL